MLKRFFDHLYARTGMAVNHQSITDQRATLAIVLSVLVKLGQADGDLSPEEVSRMNLMLQKEAGMAGAEALELLQNTVEQSQAASTTELLAQLRAELTLPQKEELLRLLYQVMHADQNKEREERDFIAALCRDLEIPEEIHVRAYLAVSKPDSKSP